MKRIILACVGAVIIVALAGVTYGYLTNSRIADKQNANESKTPAPTQTESSEKIADAQDQPGVYEEYQEGLVASTDGVRLLFFHAPWCPQCRMIEADIKENGVPNGVTVLKVDYDSHQNLRQKYGVTLQTTFVKVDREGGEVDKFVAYNEPTFDSVKRNLLDE